MGKTESILGKRKSQGLIKAKATRLCSDSRKEIVTLGGRSLVRILSFWQVF